jgi:hypothetical protein
LDEARSGAVPLRTPGTARGSRERRRPAPVTLDEVLDAHEFLKSYSGDLKSLFRRQRSAAAASSERS